MFETLLSTLDLAATVMIEGFKIVSNGGEFLTNVAALSSDSTF